MTKLREINLFRTGITDKGLKPLSGMTELKTLVLRDTAVQGAGLASVAGAKGLERIDLSETQVDDAGWHISRRSRKSSGLTSGSQGSLTPGLRTWRG